MPDRILEVAVAVIEHEGMFLITQRLPQDSFGGFWEFPGGKLLPGERMEVALIREIREELGIGIEVGTERMVIEHRYPGRTIRLHCFDCRHREGEPQPLECAGWRWVRAEHLDQFQFPPASKSLIQALQANGAQPAP